jgi:hypothetical protein
MTFKEYMNTKEQDPEKRFKWIFFLLLSMGIFIITIVVSSSQGDNVSEFIAMLMILSFLFIPIGFSKVFGNPFYNKDKNESYIDIHDGVLAYGAYKYATHKKKGSGSKISEFAKENPLLTGAIAYSAYKKIKKISDDTSENMYLKENSKNSIYQIKGRLLKTQKNILTQKISNISSTKIKSFSPFIIEINSTQVSDLLELFEKENVKYEKK